MIPMDIQIPTMVELRQTLQQSILDGDNQKFADTFDKITQRIHKDLTESMGQELENMQQSLDNNIRASRGERMLTSTERKYYQQLATAMASKDPTQALTDVNLVMPVTVIESVFEDLRTRHPLLSRLQFVTTGAAIRMTYNTNGYQQAAWGQLCDDIIKELVSGFKVANTNLLKLSAFIPVCKEALELGPEWLDRYVREVLYEAYANGLEAGIINGTGNDMPIGMNRQVGEAVNVVGGVYPLKTPIQVKALDVQTLGNLLSLLAQGPNGGTRVVEDIIMVVNPVDYYKGVLPAITLKAPDGTFQTELPFPMDIIQSPGVPLGRAVMGIARRYFAAIGGPKDGQIEYSDHYQFLEDNRVYLIKGFANGFPMDNTSFLYLDITDLEPNVYKVVQVDGRVLAHDAGLASLTLGSAALTPAFSTDVTEYTASTTNATNTVNAVPVSAGASIVVKLGETEVANGSAVTWAEGSNTLTIEVTAEDGTTTKTYTVTVTPPGND